jgi:ABC-2 type transport system permease protein
MSPRITLVTAARVLRQLAADRRTMVMLVGVPSALMSLLRFVYDGSPAVFDRIGLPLLGVFPFVLMFLVTSVAMLRERTSGTLERLLTTPTGKLDLLLGYGAAFAIAAAVQAIVATTVAYLFLGLDTAGSPAVVVSIAVANAVLGMAMGLFVSAFATSEFQAVQFMPAFVLPQILLCGLLAPRDRMAEWLTTISEALPMTYAVDALTEVGAHAEVTDALLRDGGVVAAATVLFLVAGAATLRRRSA